MVSNNKLKKKFATYYIIRFAHLINNAIVQIYPQIMYVRRMMLNKQFTRFLAGVSILQCCAVPKMRGNSG